jgi:hypothetical protein
MLSQVNAQRPAKVVEPDSNRQDDQRSQIDNEPLQRTNSATLVEPSPITTTTISRKSNPLEELKAWFDDFRRTEEAVLGRDTVVEGYRAITFFTLADGHLQRGVAIDLGDGQVLTHLTTNRGADIQELFDGAKQFIGESLQTSLTSTTDTLACNCVLYARSQVPSLPYNLTYYTQKVTIINHRFARVPIQLMVTLLWCAMSALT